MRCPRYCIFGGGLSGPSISITSFQSYASHPFNRSDKPEPAGTVATVGAGCAGGVGLGAACAGAPKPAGSSGSDVGGGVGAPTLGGRPGGLGGVGAGLGVTGGAGGVG